MNQLIKLHFWDVNRQ